MPTLLAGVKMTCLGSAPFTTHWH